MRGGCSAQASSAARARRESGGVKVRGVDVAGGHRNAAEGELGASEEILVLADGDRGEDAPTLGGRELALGAAGPGEPAEAVWIGARGGHMRMVTGAWPTRRWAQAAISLT